MNINDLLYNKNETILPRSIVYFDWCNWIHNELDENIFTCLDVRNCVDLIFLDSIFDTDDVSISMSDTILYIEESYINNIISVLWTSPVLTIWENEVNLSDCLWDLSMWFKDYKWGYFNTLWNYNIDLIWLDGLYIAIETDAIYMWLPIPNNSYFSDHLNDWPAPWQLPWDYLPFNHRLVLTRDWCNNRAIRAEDQCCPHVLEFVKWKLTADWWESRVDLKSINSDNQQLSLDSNELSLDRLNDTDSIVDLENINEHKLWLEWNRYLWIYWSDWKLNNKIDLLSVWPKTIDFDDTSNLLQILDDDWVLVSEIDISWVNNQSLSRNNWMIQMTWSVVSTVWFRKPVHFCWDTLSCLCSNWLSKSEWESFGLTWPATWTMPDWRYTRWYAQPTDWPEWWEDFLDGWPSICDIINFLVARLWWRASINNYTYINIEENAYIYNNYINNYNYTTNNVINNYNNTTNNIRYDNSYYYSHYSYYHYNHVWDIQSFINQWTEIISKTKYRGRIYSSEDRVMWSQNNWIDWTWVNARRYFPNMDWGDWWESVWDTLTDYNKMLYEDNFIVSNSDKLELQNWEIYTLTAPTDYTTSKSTNNPNTWSNWMESEFWSKTITIPFDWNYTVSLNAEVEVDHNVQAFRVSVLKRKIGDMKIYPVVDTKFGWSSSVWSRSVNNTAYPETKQYTCSWSKIVELKKWDVLFVWVRISSNTAWPKDIPAVWLNTQSPKFGSISHYHNPSTWLYVTTWSWWLDIDYTYPDTPSWFDNTTNLFWPSPMAPDLTQRWYRTPTWWSFWAENYWYSLEYPSMTQWYWDDDAVVKLLWPSWVHSPTWWWGGSTEPQWWSMLTVVYQNKSYLSTP